MDEISDRCGVKTDFTVHPDGSITADEITVPPAPAPALTIEATRERLIITELHVRDFKSYAGSRMIGPFDKNFSCIVGPNGSGKSNVIDALLFVFGYRAQKIRSKKVSVLIHKSNKYPDLNSCSVTVKFATIKDEGESFTILPDSQFSVTRTGYKDNSSTYEINGKISQYKEVANLLRKYGIDLDFNRFMILQGEIELISMMKPKAASAQETGMLEYIEDIIGSDRFIKPISHFDLKAEEANERRIEKLNQLKIVEKERADAEKPRAKALEYLGLVNKLALLENSALQAQIKVASREGEQLNEDKNTLSERINTLAASLDELQSSKQIKDEELNAIASEYDNYAKVVEDFKQQFVALERADAACRENIKSNKEKCKKLTKSLETEETKMFNIRKQPEVLKGEIQELEARKMKLEAAKAEEDKKLTELMGSVKDEIQEFQEEKDKYEEELINLKSVVNDKKSELDLAQSELNLFLSSEKKEQEKLNEFETEYEKTVSVIKEEEISMEKASERIPELKSKILSAEKDLIEKERKESILNEELKTKRVKLDEAKNSLNASKDRNTLVKVFLEQKKKGRLTGVYGRLGDLGGIDAKYDVAISTACGALDHIVTDTITTAQECVELLKKDNLGYATFIALDQMKKWEPYVKEKISTPESVPRLFDLITTRDKNVLPAFYFALRNTLVANDLDQATRVGLKGSSRHRVVTLKGELIDLSGTMSGGGGRCFKGRMGQTVMDNSFSQKEIDMLTEEIENFNNELIETKKSKTELKNIIENSNKELSTLQHSLKKSKLNYEGFVEREKMLSKQIEQQKKKVVSVAPDKKQISEIQLKIQHHEKNYVSATNEALKIENKVKELQEQILSITKGKYGSAQKKIDKLRKEIDQVSQNITKNAAMLKNTDKNLKKAESKIESLKVELETCKNSMETLKEEFQSLEGKGLEVTNKKKEAEYLIQCMSPGTRAKEIDGYPPTAENYTKAIESLKARFGCEELLVEYYVHELLTLVVKNANKSKLRITQLYDKLESHLRSLESIGMTSDKYSAVRFPLVESCIPEDILRVWLRNSVSEEKSYSARLTQLLNFLRAEVEGEERITLAKSGINQSDSYRKIHKDKEEIIIPTASYLFSGAKERNSNNIISCIFCEKSHQNKDCYQAQNLTHDEKLRIMKEKNCCFACLKPNQRAKNCKSKVQCVFCGRKHYIVCCPEFKQKSKAIAECKQENCESSTLSSTCTSGRVFLQTLVVAFQLEGKKFHL
ncbi:structural maintenance of chromosomes protein 4 [Trichonephila clavipes]|nr:structural maintenance of chromosomes protein 4 [Trichonephila clavipes]